MLIFNQTATTNVVAAFGLKNFLSYEMILLFSVLPKNNFVDRVAYNSNWFDLSNDGGFFLWKTGYFPFFSVIAEVTEEGTGHLKVWVLTVESWEQNFWIYASAPLYLYHISINTSNIGPRTGIKVFLQFIGDCMLRVSNNRHIVFGYISWVFPIWGLLPLQFTNCLITGDWKASNYWEIIWIMRVLVNCKAQIHEPIPHILTIFENIPQNKCWNPSLGAPGPLFLRNRATWTKLFHCPVGGHYSIFFIAVFLFGW